MHTWEVSHVCGITVELPFLMIASLQLYLFLLMRIIDLVKRNIFTILDSFLVDRSYFEVLKVFFSGTQHFCKNWLKNGRRFESFNFTEQIYHLRSKKLKIVSNRQRSVNLMLRWSKCLENEIFRQITKRLHWR